MTILWTFEVSGLVFAEVFLELALKKFFLNFFILYVSFHEGFTAKAVLSSFYPFIINLHIAGGTPNHDFQKKRKQNR